MNTKTRSALRASLKQEDAALDERLPEAAATATNTTPDSPAAAPARKPQIRRARQEGRKPAQPATKGIARAEPEPAKASTPCAPPSVATPPVPAVDRPNTRTSVPAAKPSRAKAEKRQRKSFSLAAGDLRRIEALRGTMKAAGRPTGKSELVRAALAALAALDENAASALLDALPPLKRTTAKRDGKAKGDKKRSPRRKAADRKR